MRDQNYKEFVENGEHRIYVGKPGTGPTMTLTWSNNGEVLTFQNRKACFRWLLAACPGSGVYATDGEVSVCAGSVRNLAEAAGIKPSEPCLFA